MSKSLSSASSSTPTRATSTNTRLTPAIIPLDYNYQTMSPSALPQQRSAASVYSQQARAVQPSASAAASIDELDVDSQQYSSLFGDPVPPPPPTDFLGSEFESPPLFRATSIEISSEEELFGRAVTAHSQTQLHTRLFSEVPYSSSVMGRRCSNYGVLATAVPRLQPPDIQILPNSSGGSGSSDARDSPNFALLTPNDILRKPGLYELIEQPHLTELIETMTISDASGKREYSEATRRMSSFSEDFKSNVGSLSFSPPTDTQEDSAYFGRQFSNEPYSNNDWFHPALHDFPDFSKMPKLRPSSKNVMSIKRDEMPMHHSPVAAMLNDSNGSSSSEERVLDTTQTLERPTVSLDALAPARPPVPSPSLLRDMEHDLLQSPQSYLPYQARRRSSLSSLDPNLPPPLPAAPPPISAAPSLELHELNETITIKREMSPVILRDSVATGSDYRVDDARLHKKASFSIISPKSPQSSLTQSPGPQKLRRASTFIPTAANRQYAKDHSATTTPTSSTAQPVAKPRYQLQRKSLSTTQLKLPQLSPRHQPTHFQQTFEDSPRPSVQFNMSGRYSPSKMPHKGILQHRESLSSSQETTPLPDASTAQRRLSNTLPAAAAAAPAYGDKGKSYEALPLIADAYRTAIPRLHRSDLALHLEPTVIPPGALPRPLKPNPNPTRKQRGLLRIINSEESMSRIPLRSNWASMDDLAAEQRRRNSLSPLNLPQRRRSSSTSPERRSSTQTASDRRSSNLSSITTSDFSFRRPSVLQASQSKQRKSLLPATGRTAQRRQSLVAPSNALLGGNRTPRTKIAKPTTLSPIIGTPNKDSSSPQHSTASGISAARAASETASDATSRRNSISSKIPVRSDDHARSSSRQSLHSRTSSPLKEFTSQLPLSGLTSRANSSRSPSRATARSESQPTSRANSQAPSRSTSRASTRPISLAPSRGSSRSNSRTELAQKAVNSRSNSRSELANAHMSVHSGPRAGSVSPTSGLRQRGSPPNRRQSMSLSPNAMRRGTRSKNPAKQSPMGRAERPLERRSSRSRIPTRARSGSVSATYNSPSKPKTSAAATAKQREPSKASPPRKPAVPRRQPVSAKKPPTPAQKPDSSVKRASSLRSKQSPAAVKRQPSNLQKTDSNLKRQASNLQKPTKTTAASAAAKTPKREAAATNAKKALTRSASSLKQLPPTKATSKTIESRPTESKAAEAKTTTAAADESHKAAASVVANLEQAEQTAAATTAAIAAGTASTAVATTAAGASVTAAPKRQPANKSLLRMGSKISLMSKKRSDSNLSKRSLAAQPLLEASDSTEEAHAQPDRSTAAPTKELTKMNSAGQLVATEAAGAILEKSQKTLENIQKTVTDATDEIHKTINENLTDLKSLEQDMSKNSDSAASPTSSVTTVVENKAAKSGGASVSRLGTAEGAAANTAESRSPVPPTQPIEAAVSVLNTDAAGAGATATAHAAGTADAAERNYELDIADKTDAAVADNGVAVEHAVDDGSADDFKSEAKRRSPDGQRGSPAGSGGRTGSQEFLEERDEEQPAGCCACCARFCIPCRRSRCSQCCRRKKTPVGNDESEQPVLSATSSTTTTNLEVIDETQPTKTSCWQKLNCCKRCRRKKKQLPEEVVDELAAANEQAQLEAVRAEARQSSFSNQESQAARKQSKCGLCWSKVFCCRSVNKIETTSGMETELKKCCFCIPCRRKRGPRASAVAAVDGAASAAGSGAAAWQDPERGISATDASVLEGGNEAVRKDGCCKRFWRRLLCCRKKPAIQPADSRRQSIKAPPPPAEDTRRKLHVDLVEYNSKMKGAIPVMPLFLAWICAICNVVLPGLGTLLSGFFCICVGIPRFSQYDSAKARFGSLIINIIVATAQFFCVLFCFVGWGWSIWWGTIMLKCARKLSKIKKVERLEMEEERRQAEAAAAAARVVHTEPEVAKT